jgi:hypothetical protein
MCQGSSIDSSEKHFFNDSLAKEKIYVAKE